MSALHARNVVHPEAACLFQRAMSRATRLRQPTNIWAGIGYCAKSAEAA
jgi:hypothetical protein